MSELIEYFVRHYTLVLDNTESTHKHVTGLAQGVVKNSDLTLTEWKGLTTAERNERFASDIGSLVIDAIEEYVDADVPGADSGIGAALVRELLILGSSDLEYELGKHYMPEDSDVEKYLTDEDDEDSDDEA
jgi:hypothetical protein